MTLALLLIIATLIHGVVYLTGVNNSNRVCGQGGVCAQTRREQASKQLTETEKGCVCSDKEENSEKRN